MDSGSTNGSSLVRPPKQLRRSSVDDSNADSNGKLGVIGHHLVVVRDLESQLPTLDGIKEGQDEQSFLLSKDRTIKQYGVAKIIIEVLNYAEKYTLMEYFISNCVANVTLSTLFMEEHINGIYQFLGFWILTLEMFPDGIWHLRSADLVSDRRSDIHKIRLNYGFSGTRINPSPTKDLFHAFLESTSTDRYKDVMHMDDVKSGMDSLYSELATLVGSSSIRLIDDTESLPLYSQEHSLGTLCAPTRGENAEAIYERNLTGEVLGDTKEVGSVVDCHGTLYIEFNEEDRIKSIQLDVDAESDRCDKDLW